MSYTREILNPMKVEELRKIASSLGISCSKLKKQECIDNILNSLKAQKSTTLSESFLRSKTASELRKILIDYKDKYNCCASKISGDKVGKELMINIILEKIKCPKDYMFEIESMPPSPRRQSPSPRRQSPSPRRQSPSPRKKSLSLHSQSPSKKYSKDDLDKMNVKQLVNIVKKMGLDSVCKVGVTKPVLIDYIINGDCSKENRKKGKENVKLQEVKSPVKKSQVPLEYKESDLKKLTKQDLLDIVKKMGLDSLCKLEVTKPVLIDYILKRDCTRDKRKKGKEDILNILKHEISYTEEELNKKSDNEIKDIIRSLGLDIICNLNVSREILIKYILLRGCPEQLFKKSPEPVMPIPESEPKPVMPMPMPIPEPPSDVSDVKDQYEEEPLYEAEYSDVSSVDEDEEDIDDVDRKKLVEMSKALRECLGFTQKKI